MRHARLVLSLLLGSIFMMQISLSHAVSPVPEESKPLDMGEDPGPVYTRLMKEYADTIHFAQNESTIAVDRLQYDMQHNPKLQKLYSKNLIADLHQYFYEIFISPETIEALAKVYAEYYSLDELQALIDFYRSPLGQKMIKLTPDINLKTQKIAVDLLKAHERGYLEIMAKYEKAAEQQK